MFLHYKVRIIWFFFLQAHSIWPNPRAFNPAQKSIEIPKFYRVKLTLDKEIHIPMKNILWINWKHKNPRSYILLTVRVKVLLSFLDRTLFLDLFFFYLWVILLRTNILYFKIQIKLTLLRIGEVSLIALMVFIIYRNYSLFKKSFFD